MKATHEFKSSEFRYKNYISHKGTIWQINDIFGASGLITVLPKNNEGLGRRSMHDFEPIPLTEEILVKLEFSFLKKKSGTQGVYSNGKINLVISNCGNVYWVNKIIPYVHTLQNLYFVLKNEELNGSI